MLELEYRGEVKSSKKQKVERECCFVGEAVSEAEAMERWGWRYELKAKRRKGQGWILNAGGEDEVHLNVECHYLQANVGGCIFSLGDCVHIKGEEKQPLVGRILEFFKTSDDQKYFRVQWYFRAEDTVLKQAAAFHDKKRLFYSTLMNDNLLDCILSKVRIIEKDPSLGFLSTSIQPSEYYCDMEYSVKYSTFRSLVTGHIKFMVKAKYNNENTKQTLLRFKAVRRGQCVALHYGLLLTSVNSQVADWNLRPDTSCHKCSLYPVHPSSSSMSRTLNRCKM